MRTAVDLEFSGTPVRILTEIPEIATHLQQGLSEHLSSTPGPVGFVVTRTRARERLLLTH